MAREKKTTKREKIINSKNNTEKMIKIWMKKLIKTPIIQVSFMYILKISAMKSIKTSLTSIVKITEIQECKMS